MKLATLNLDDMVVIPGGKRLGEDTFTDLRDSVFRAADGWEIHETLPGTFSVTCAHMAEAVTIGGYGYTYTRAKVDPIDTEAPVPAPAKGKRR